MDDRHAIENFLLTGAEEDFCALFEAVYPRVRRYFLLRGMEVGEAEELAQDVMVIVYQRAGEVREKEFFNGWLFKVAKNELARFWRRRQTRKRVAEMEPLEEVIRGSGHYGSRVEVPADADAQTKLLGFIGRDPLWGRRSEGPDSSAV